MKDSLKQLILANLRELIRDKMTFFFVLIFPFLFIFLFVFISMANGKVPQGVGGSQVYDPLRYSLPGILVMAFTSLGMFGLATPLIMLRQRGTLRLLGLTPLSPLDFVLAQLVVRLILALVQLIVILIVSYILVGNIPFQNLPGIFLSAFLCIVMLFALAYVLGEIIPSPEVAGGLMGGMMAPALMLTGILLPFSIMPDIVLTVARFIPLTYLGDALRQQIIGGTPIASLAVDDLVLFGTAVALIALAVRLFRWGQPDTHSIAPKRAKLVNGQS